MEENKNLAIVGNGCFHPSPVKKTFSGLDIIKICSAILLVFHHYQQSLSVTFSGANFFGGTLYLGYIVELFFLISGFLCVHTIRVGKSSFVNCIKEFWRRILRFLPMATVALIFCLCVKSVRAVAFGIGQLSNLWNIKALIANFFLIFKGWPYFNMLGINNPTWYLCILIQCYLIFYVILFLSGKLRVNRTIVFAAVAAAVFFLKRYGVLIQDESFRGLECFFGGAVMYDVLKSIKSKKFLSRNSVRIIVTVLSLILITASFVVIYTKNIGMGVWQRRILLAGVLPELMLLSFNINVKRKAEFIRTLGNISFEVYIWHAPFLSFFKLIMDTFNFQIESTYLTMIVFTLIVFALSALLYKYVETPIGRLIKKRTSQGA